MQGRHAVVWYRVLSLFSARALTANAFSAVTLPCPAPATVKMALLAHLVARDGPGRAQEHLGWLAPLAVAWAAPGRMAVSAAMVRVLKGDDDRDPTGEKGMEYKKSAALREYVHMDEPFGIAILDVPGERREDLAEGLERLSFLGVAESLVRAERPVEWVDELPDGFVVLKESETKEPGSERGGWAVLLDDLGPRADFGRISAYRKVGDPGPRLGVERVRMLVRLPLRVRRRTRDGYVLERVDR
ncbi:MAG: hypothetical protein QJR14_08570 [Bacillota bacterium]|nr:hypothetical protein [Bacillota bacterium]